ncbi:MAG: helix-turn-helix transcriptional regulator [Actinomycetales bacterium]|nr:helix-turn-helix transcriptional regulator [Actinomycetales bacterium]
MDATVISLAERRAASGRVPRPARTAPPPPPPTERDHRSQARVWRRSIGHLLRTARLDAALRLVDVAEAAGVSPQYLSEVERGRKEPSSEVLAAVTGALGMSLVDLAHDLAREVAAPSGGVRLAA